SLRAGQGKRGSSAVPFPCTLSPAHWRLPKGESIRQKRNPFEPHLSRLISHWKQTLAAGSPRIGIKVHFQAHLRIGKCWSSLALTTWVVFQLLGTCRLLPVTRKLAPAASAHSRKRLSGSSGDDATVWAGAARILTERSRARKRAISAGANFRRGYKSACTYSLRIGSDTHSWNFSFNPKRDDQGLNPLFVDFGDPRECAYVLAVGLAGGDQGADVLRVGFDGGAESLHVVVEQFEALGEGFVAIGEPFEAFVDGHGCLLV